MMQSRDEKRKMAASTSSIQLQAKVATSEQSSTLLLVRFEVDRQTCYSIGALVCSFVLGESQTTQVWSEEKEENF